MSERMIHLNEGAIKQELKELVRTSVEETLNELLDQKASELVKAGRHERTQAREGYRAGHYERGLTTASGEIRVKMPKLKGAAFETAIIGKYRRRESSIEEATVEMYLAGVSVRRVEDITEALWGTRVSAGTVSEMNKKVYVHIEAWRTRQLKGQYRYVYMDGIYLKRNWGGGYENVAVLVAIGVNEEGYREVIGAAEGMKERGLDGPQLFIGDRCIGLLDAVNEVYPEAKFQRCTVHFYRNMFSVTPRSKVKTVAAMLKAIHAQESKEAAQEKASAVAVKLREMKLREAADKLEKGIDETLTYMDFPSEHWTRLRCNNVIERLNREIEVDGIIGSVTWRTTKAFATQVSNPNPAIRSKGMRKMLFVIAAFSCCCLISACTLIPNFSEDHTNSNVPHKPTASPAATNIPIAVPTPAQKLCIQGDGVAESGLGQVSVSGQFSADEMASFINDVRDETQSLHAAMDKYGLFIPLDISIRGSDSGVRDIREYDYGKHHMIQALYSNVRLLFVFEKNLDRFNAQTVLICNDGGSISTAIEFQSISEENWLILRYPSTVGSGYTSEQETWYSLKRKCVELSYYTRVSNYIYMNPMAVPHSWKVESSMRNGRVIIEGHFYIDNVEGAHLYDKAVSYVLEFDEQSKRFYVEEGIEDFMIWIPFLKQDALDALRD